MPSVQPGSSILVTGANGFLAAHVVKNLLDKGFAVRGTVRSANKGKPLERLFTEYGERFTYIVVPDVNAPSAYDEAIKGVSAIIHIAAAMPQAVTDINDILRPNVDGTIALLETARKPGSTVQRVVLTSSVGALMENKEGHYQYSEADWNDFMVGLLQAHELAVGPLVLYVASKILQEKAAWEFVKAHKAQLPFDFVALVIGSQIGPPLNESATPPSSLMFVNEALKGQPSIGGFEPFEMVDVRDAAELHVRSLLKEEAGGERITVSGHNYCYQDLLDTVHASSPNAVGVPKGTPGSGKTKVYEKTFDNTKSRRIFNFEYRSAEETARDTWVAFVKRGWAQESA